MLRFFKRFFDRIHGMKSDQIYGEGGTDGYYAATVGERGGWEVVKRYVKNQGNRKDIDQLRLF